MPRVLIVDDSPTSRQSIAEILGSDPDIEVVGTAVCGLEGVRMAKELRPDVITMDIQMPGMNGFEATKEIMIDAPTSIVIVSSSTVIQEVEAAMQALRAGALTLLAKPAGPKSPRFEQSAREMIETVKAMADVKVVRHRRRVEPPDKPTRSQAETPQRPDCVAPEVAVIAIATSTGGPPALNCLLSGLPPDIPVPVVVVQHIAAGFVEGFANWLDSSVPHPVKLAEENELLKPGTVYIAPQDRHLGVARGGRVVLSDEDPIDGFRPSATHLFQSVARTFGKKSLAIILTGMGRDGLEGLRSIRQEGGFTIAQDEESCVVFGMPGVAVEAGLADKVLPIDRIAGCLLKVLS